MSRGARHLVLLSRWGVSSAAAAGLVNELTGAGVKVVTPACDVGDLEALRQALVEAAKHIPPIMGCMQASMILQVCSDIRIDSFDGLL